MNKRYIQSFRPIFLDPENEEAGLAEISSILPKRAARRMSCLGRMMAWVLDGVPLDLRTIVVYGTTFTESRALETYLDSFPYASPMAFQKSIHPGGIEQAFIMNKREIGAFFPMAGQQDLLAAMLKFAFLEKTGSTVICGGEESARWLACYGLALPRSFAFSMHVTADPDGAIGKIEWDPEGDTTAYPAPDMEECLRLLEQTRRLRMESACHGNFILSLK